MEDKLNWGFVIRHLMEQRSLTQEELAVKSGMTREHISLIVTGKIKHPKDDHIIKLATGLDVPRSELWAKILSFSRSGENIELPERNRTPQPMQIPVYTSFPFHAGSPKMPIEYIHRAVAKESPKHIEGYIVHGNCLEPKIEEGDIIIVDREGQIDNGDIVACLMNDELHLARLRKVADELWLENNNRKYRFEECQLVSPVIEVIKRLK